MCAAVCGSAEGNGQSGNCLLPNLKNLNSSPGQSAEREEMQDYTQAGGVVHGFFSPWMDVLRYLAHSSRGTLVPQTKSDSFILSQTLYLGGDGNKMQILRTVQIFLV